MVWRMIFLNFIIFYDNRGKIGTLIRLWKKLKKNKKKNYRKFSFAKRMKIFGARSEQR